VYDTVSYTSWQRRAAGGTGAESPPVRFLDLGEWGRGGWPHAEPGGGTAA